jgi:hypothetical protein
MESFHRQVGAVVMDYLAFSLKLMMIRTLLLRVYFLLRKLKNAVENYVT